MRIVGLIVPLLVIIGLLVNMGREILLWLKLLRVGLSPLVYGIIYGLAIIAIVAAFIASRVPDIGIPRIAFLIGHHALGVLAYLIIIINAVSFLLLLGKLVHLIPTPIPEGVRLVSGAISMLLVAGLTIYGAVHAANIQTSRYTVQIGQGRVQEALAPEMDSLRIALISDTHLGYVMEEKHLTKVVAAVNAINPDIICITGDIFDGDMTALENPENLQALFREMDSTYGIYACLGNHDAGASYEQMLEFLSGADIRVLMDEAIVIDERFILAGRRDSSPIGGQGGVREALKGLPETKELPVIVMDHQPGNIREYGSEADLVLCGHTHRGQMFPFNLITDAIFDVDYGYYRASDEAPHIIVTSGAGTWGPPGRVATDNEVVEINMVFQK